MRGINTFEAYRNFLMDSLTYINREDELIGFTRTVSVYVEDDKGNRSNVAYTTIEFLFVNDNPPIADNITHTSLLKENISDGVIVDIVYFTDADTGTDNRVECQLTGNSDSNVQFTITQPSGLVCYIIANSTNTDITRQPFDYERTTSYSLLLLAVEVPNERGYSVEVSINIDVSSFFTYIYCTNNLLLYYSRLSYYEC